MISKGKQFTVTCGGDKRFVHFMIVVTTRLLPLLLLCLLSPVADAQYTYTTNNGAITITKYTGSDGEVTIPDTIDGLPVSAIGIQAFYRCSNLTNITISQYVTNIGNQVFYNCSNLNTISVDPRNSTFSGVDGVLFNSNLTTIVLCPNARSGSYTVPDNVISIGPYAFYSCNRLTNVTIGIGVTNIGTKAFLLSSSLTSFLVNELNPCYYSVDGVLFDKSQASLLQFPGGKGNSYVIPASVTNIENYAFYGCANLIEVTIPKYAVRIGDWAFMLCQHLNSFTVDELNPNYCSVNGVLFDKSQTTLIQYPGARVGFYAIPDGVTNIAHDSFSFCGGILDITIPNSVITIDTYAFYGCYKLTNAILSASVTTIGYHAFAECTGLSRISFMGNAPSFDRSVFGYVSSANVYYLPNTTGWGITFSERPAMMWDEISQFGYTISNGTVTLVKYGGPDNRITIPDLINTLPVTDIGDNLFKYRFNLTNITIGNNITVIGASAFYSCNSLTNLNIPNNVRSIGNNAFESCKRLTTVTVGNSVTNIGNKAFGSCDKLRSLFFLGNAPAIGQTIFNNVYNVTVYASPGTTGWGSKFAGAPAMYWNSQTQYGYIINNSTISLTKYDGSESIIVIPAVMDGLPVTSIGGAFSGNTNLTSITIPAGVTNIGMYAFLSCTNLTDIYFRGNAPSLGAYAFTGDNNVIAFYMPGTTGWGTAFGGIPAILGEARFADCIYINNGGHVTITKYTGSGGAVIIPDSISGFPVKGIAGNAFNSCIGLTNITLPNDLAYIGDNAFYNCRSLTNIALPSGITNIGKYAFYLCLNLASITIPESLISINESVFQYCVQLTTLSIPDGVRSIEKKAFNQCTNLASITIGNNVTNIGDLAFANCFDLTNVTIGQRVTTIGSKAFSGCSSISEIILPSGVTTIKPNAFENCSSLLNVDMPNTISQLGAYVFYNCTSLTNITIPNRIKIIDTESFYNCANLTNITFPNGIIHISTRAFENCVNLTNIIIPDSVTTLGEHSFFSCSNITSIFIGKGISYIGSGAFGACFNLRGITVDLMNTNLCSLDGILFDKKQTILMQYPANKPASDYTIPVSVVTVADGAFSGCTNLVAITIPDRLETIGNSAFSSCSYLDHITLGMNVRSLGNAAFYNCTNLVEITIPDRLQDIGSSAFYGCSRMTSVYLGINVLNIGIGAFQYCTSLTNIIIPDKVISIESDAFSHCNNLSSFTFGNGISKIMSGTFACCNSLTNIAIPDTISFIGDNAFASCANLNSVFLGSMVMKLGYGAFDNCNNLRSIVVDDLNNTFASIDGVLFSKDLATLILYPRGMIGSYNIPSSVNWISDRAFYQCNYLTSISIPSSVLSIGYTLSECVNLTSITVDDRNLNYSSINGVLLTKNQTALIRYPNCDSITYTVPNSVTNIWSFAFKYCSNMTGIYFQGNAPYVNQSAFYFPNNTTAYYLPGTTGWEATFGGLPAVLWNPMVQTSVPSFGVQSNQFGFNITSTNNLVVVVDACTNLTNPTWLPVGTNTLTDGTSYFSDPQWTNHPARFYRLRMP